MVATEFLEQLRQQREQLGMPLEVLAAKAGVPAELHIYEKGPHGVGLAQKDPVLSGWSTCLSGWLKSRGLQTK